MSFEAGQYYQICDVCSFKFLSSIMKKRWDGLIVCPPDYETDHPQKFITSLNDKISVEDPRPRAADVFISVCTLITRAPVASVGEAGCMTVGAVPSLPLPVGPFYS